MSEEIKLKDLIPDEFYINDEGIMCCELSLKQVNLISGILINLQQESQKLKQWDKNKDTRNSRQRVTNAKLIKENQQLKEELNKYKRIYRENPTLYDEIAPYIINECNLENKLKQYKFILDEIREYIKEHNDYLEKAKEIYIGYEDELLKSTCIQLINNELVRSDNLLQILDKVKE